jgi:hypothetical protein
MCVRHLVEKRWTRYGMDQVYVRTSEGTDLQRSANDRLLPPTAEPAIDLPPPDPSQPLIGPSTHESAPRDLAANTAGAAARAKRDEVNAEAPFVNLVARVFGVKTEERNWRVGAKGEEKVAKELRKLGTGWNVLHAVEVGDRGSDIDHVVIGPAGVFTLNTKRHPRAKAWAAEHAVLLNGQRTHYLRNSRHEGQRAARLLTSACGFAVAVLPAIVFVDLESFTVKSQPADVHVTTRRRLVAWLDSLPVVLDETTLEKIYAQARLSTTWSSGPHSRDDRSE